MHETLSESGLSDREKEVLSLAADGLTDKEIALRLSIATKTVRTYWDRMRQKLSATSRTQVIAKAFRETYKALRQKEITYLQLLDFCQEGIWSLVEACSDPIARFDKDCTCLKVNAAFARLVNRKTFTLSGKTISDLDNLLEADLWQEGILTAIQSRKLQTKSTLGIHGKGPGSTIFIPEAENGNGVHTVLCVCRRSAN
jgi:DNA-binding CsgD family transcriptional regulator